MDNKSLFLIDTYLVGVNNDNYQQIHGFIINNFNDNERTFASCKESNYSKYIKVGLFSSIESVKKRISLITDKFVHLNNEMQKLGRSKLFIEPENAILSFIWRDILAEFYEESIAYKIKDNANIIYSELKNSLLSNSIKSATLKNIVGKEIYSSLLGSYVLAYEGVNIDKLSEKEMQNYFLQVINALEGNDDFIEHKYKITYSIFNKENTLLKDSLLTLYKKAYKLDRVALFVLSILHHPDLQTEDKNKYLEEVICNNLVKITDFSGVCLKNTTITNKYLKMSGELNFAPANHTLAFLMTAVLDTSLIDTKQLLTYYEKAVKENYAPSLNNLGQIYISGKYDIPQNITLGLELLFKAVSLGYEKAKINLAWAFGYKVDSTYYDLLFPYLKESATIYGDIYIRELGNAYFYGKGTTTDYENALLYLDTFYYDNVLKHYSNSLE